MENPIAYKIASTENDYSQCKDIIIEYLQTLDIDISYMNLYDEFALMDKMYGSNQGVFILALANEIPIGCVGIRKQSDSIAELKRFYVKDIHRGKQVGVQLLSEALESARLLGYQKIRLDVIPTLQKAKDLYLSFGFYEIEPYFKNPVEGTTYMEKII